MSSSGYGPWCGKCYTAPRCECGWTVGNHQHDSRMGKAVEASA